MAEEGEPSSATGATKPNQYDRAWENKYKCLVDYYKSHGHTLVPVSEPTLGRWVQRQRAQYKKGTMPDNRKMSLVAVDFVFDVNEYKRSKKEANAAIMDGDGLGDQKQKKWTKLSWEERYHQLKEYFDANGNSNVPEKYGSLGGWVQYQRRSKEKLSRDQKDQLEQLNFIWDMKDHQWKTKLEEMKQFMQQNNHSHVPSTEEYRSLQAWCITQRKLHQTKYDKNKQNKTASALTDERESLLNEIGFDWDTSHEHIWHQRIEQLKEYKKQHGHVILGKKDGVLGAWADTQRTEYRYKVAGHHTHLTDKRVLELEALGFAWSIREVQWNDNYQSVLRYMEGKEQSRDKTRMDPSLVVWLRDQKLLYDARTNGEQNSLLEERAEKLSALMDRIIE